MAEVVDADPEVDPAGLHGGEPHLSPKAVARDRRANPRRKQQLLAADRLGPDVSRDLVQPPCRTPNVRGSLFFGYGLTRKRSPVGEFFLDVSTIVSSTLTMRLRKSTWRGHSAMTSPQRIPVSMNVSTNSR